MVNSSEFNWRAFAVVTRQRRRLLKMEQDVSVNKIEDVGKPATNQGPLAAVNLGGDVGTDPQGGHVELVTQLIERLAVNVRMQVCLLYTSPSPRD